MLTDRKNGRYYVGIDVGRFNIDTCFIDYKAFRENAAAGADKLKIFEASYAAPDDFSKIYDVICAALVKIMEQMKGKGINANIDGIGIGLPGQVNPNQGTLIESPGFSGISNESFIRQLSLKIRAKNILKSTDIKIDNDVRCATRYLWKSIGFKDGICIFIGNGLGSGIVLDNKMLYGHNFVAGEIGHTTISSEGSWLFKESGDHCNCKAEGCHWEMYASSYGLVNIAKRLCATEYDKLKNNYGQIITQTKYKELLRTPYFKEYSVALLYDDVKEELTSHFFSLAFYANNSYAITVVKAFIHFLAIGIANYINVINPQTIYLGGGMVKGFCAEISKRNELINPPVDTMNLLKEEVARYVLKAASDVDIQKLDPNEAKASSIGAALIYDDDSYFSHMN